MKFSHTMDKDAVRDASQAAQDAFSEILDGLPTIAKNAKIPRRRQHMLRVMFKLAEGAGIGDLREGISDVTQRTLENDLTILRRAGVLRSKPRMKTAGKWGH